MTGEFSVYQFFEDGMSERVCTGVDAKNAVEAAHHYCHCPAAKLGIVRRVIITDGGDCTTFEWKHGEGVTYPTPEMRRDAAGRSWGAPPGERPEEGDDDPVPVDDEGSET
jgi:hypothetical protein